MKLSAVRMAPRFFLHVKGWVHGVNILLIQLFPQLLDAFAKPLEVDDLPFPEELDHITDIRVIAEPQDIVISHPGLLLWRSGTLATIIHRNIGNKRLISIK